MVTDLVEIRSLAEAKAAENLRFRRYIKAHHCPERLLHDLARQIESQIDCTECANCCRETRVDVSREDLDGIARYLQTTSEKVAGAYTEPDRREGGRMLRHQKGGCVFLDGNLCVIYEARPRACRDFPYLVPAERSVGNRMSSQCRRAAFCPIVFNALEEYKKLMGYHPCR